MAAKSNTPRKPRKVRPALSLDQYVIQEATPDTMRRFRKTRGVRDAEQQAVDKLVLGAYQKWLDAGSPAVWTDQNGVFVRLPEREYDTFKWRVQRAAQFQNLRYRFGEVVSSGDGSKVETVFIVTAKLAGDTE